MSDSPLYVHPGGRAPWYVRLRAYLPLWSLACIVFAADQLSKWAVIRTLPYNPYHDHHPDFCREVIPGFFYLIHVGNTGAAWSLFAGRSTLLALIALATLSAIFFFRRHLALRVRLVQIAFGLLCGGIVGNLVDRLLHGHVVDFLDFHFGSYIYPTFNIADMGICVGVALYFWFSWRTPAETPQTPPSSPQA